jgi:hypothetical protein
MTLFVDPDCDGCQEPLADTTYDPGCNYGCGFSSSMPPDCHERFCTEQCFENTNERRAERAYERFHGR